MRVTPHLDVLWPDDIQEVVPDNAGTAVTSYDTGTNGGVPNPWAAWQYLNASKTPSKSAWAPDTPDLTVTTDMVVTAKVRATTPLVGAYHLTIASTIGDAAPNYGWRFWISYGLLQFGYAADIYGDAPNDRTLATAVQLEAAFVENVDFYIGVVFRPNDAGSHRAWAITSVDGVTWTQIGTPYSLATPLPDGINDANARLQIGAQHDSGQHQWVGRIYWAEQRRSTVPGQGTLVWRFDATEYPGSGTTYTDPRGRVWTLTNAAAIGR